MGFSNLVAFFIILTTRRRCTAHGVTDIQTSAQAAEALRPVAGDFTFLLFSLGHHRHRHAGRTGAGRLGGLRGGRDAFIGTPGSNLRLEDGKEFYAIISFATLGGVALNFTPIDPIKALFWSAVINGVIAVPIMAVMMYLGCAAQRPRTLRIRKPSSDSVGSPLS